MACVCLIDARDLLPARVGDRHALLPQVGPRAMRKHAQRKKDRRDKAMTWPF
jgi:hypothetical protein